MTISLLRHLSFWVLLCGGGILFADTNEEQVVRNLYRHATMAPPPAIQVRALLRLTEPAWTKDQIEEQVQRQFKTLGDESPEPEIAEMNRKAVASVHAGVRWFLCQETKLPNFYRVDIKDYRNVQPIVDDELVHSNDVFESYLINNYGRKDLPYKESNWNNYGMKEPHFLKGGRVFIDNTASPSMWGQENLFVAKQLEGRASFALVALLKKDIGPDAAARLLATKQRENMDLISPVPMDEAKLRELLSGTNSIGKIQVRPGTSPTAWVVVLSLHSDQGDGTVSYSIDEKLPYLVSSASIVGNSGSYSSQRTGNAPLGFPSIWRTEENSASGEAKSKEIQILSVTTNFDIAAALATNYPPDAQVWERTKNGEMRKVSGSPEKP